MSEQEAASVEIVRVPTEAPTSIATPASISEIETMVKRARYLGEQLDNLRAVAVARTVKSDWVAMGETVYLEGDGALRMAPVLGLKLTNVRKEVQVDEDGVIRVTYTADAESLLFNVKFENISKTRRSDEPYLKKGGEEDVASAAYKSLVSRACQLVGGFSGLTPDELKDRYGLEAKGRVEYKTGLKDAKKEDAAKGKDDRAEINRLLVKLSEGDTAFAERILVDLTKNESKGWPGKKRAEDLSEGGVAYVLRKLKEREADFDSVGK